MVTQDARAASPEAVTQDAAAAGPELPRPPVTERVARFLPGLLMLVLGIVLILVGVGLIVLANHESGGTAKALIWLGEYFSPLASTHASPLSPRTMV